MVAAIVHVIRIGLPKLKAQVASSPAFPMKTLIALSVAAFDYKALILSAYVAGKSNHVRLNHLF